MCFISNLFNVPASDKTISSVPAGCVVKAVAPVILETSKPLCCAAQVSPPVLPDCFCKK